MSGKEWQSPLFLEKWTMASSGPLCLCESSADRLSSRDWDCCIMVRLNKQASITPRARDKMYATPPRLRPLAWPPLLSAPPHSPPPKRRPPLARYSFLPPNNTPLRKQTDATALQETKVLPTKCRYYFQGTCIGK